MTPTPGPYDGFLVELDDGAFKIEANGVVIRERECDRNRARAILFEHAGDKPKWTIGRDGSSTPLV